MSLIKITESVEIKVQQNVAYEYLLNFENWPKWSPWLICEQDAKLFFQEESYSWQGKFIGEGNMFRLNSIKSESIFYNLTFLKPWKSHAEVEFKFSPTQGGVLIEWSMSSKLPWFLFFLQKTMRNMIKMDYQRGLRILKEKLETGELESKLSYKESHSFSAVEYLGISRVCRFDELGSSMEKDFRVLNEDLISSSAGEVFCIYEKWDLSREEATYILASSVDNFKEATNKGKYDSGTRAACSAFCVVHSGDYKHLGNAWAAGICRQQAKLFKTNKRVSPFEIYEKMGNGLDCVTRVCFPSL